MTRTIEIDDETYALLTDLKRDEESFDEVLGRLLERRRERIREGAGYWEEADVEAAKDVIEQTREDLKRFE